MRMKDCNQGTPVCTVEDNIEDRKYGHILGFSRTENNAICLIVQFESSNENPADFIKSRVGIDDVKRIQY